MLTLEDKSNLSTSIFASETQKYETVGHEIMYNGEKVDYSILPTSFRRKLCLLGNEIFMQCTMRYALTSVYTKHYDLTKENECIYEKLQIANNAFSFLSSVLKSMPKSNSSCTSTHNVACFKMATMATIYDVECRRVHNR